ncbi:MAG: hypothetical protein U0169_24590 [Polyangiaceae bacterium]
MLKAKRQTVEAGESSAKRPAKAPLARAEIVDKSVRGRFEAEIDAAVKRKEQDPSEIRLVGALRPLAKLSPSLRAKLADAATTLQKRGARDRVLYNGALRILSECGDKATTPLLKIALTADDAGGTSALAAAALSRDAALAPFLAKVASSRQSHLAFAAETARVARGESNGVHLAALAPMIKESHRISLCGELFVPIARGAATHKAIGPALTVLRSAERHLGRWLVLAEVAAKAGDPTPIDEARTKSTVGPTSSRAAWACVAWALDEVAPGVSAASPLPAPETRPTVELMARLSDRPSADRDMTFLFRMARAGLASPKAMLESLAKGPPLADELALRAALYLVKNHGASDLVPALLEASSSAGIEELRGLATAAAWDTEDASVRDRVLAHADELADSPILANVAWSALVRAASRGGATYAGVGGRHSVLHESSLRWIHWAWIE